MNCERIKREILLDSSGELGHARRARMIAHVEGCASCRAYRNLLPALGRAAARGDDIPPLSAFTVTSILLEAERREDEAGHRRDAWLHFWRQPAFAAAAATLAFAVGLGAVWLRQKPAADLAFRADEAASYEWIMADWVDVKLDLLSDELALAVDDVALSKENETRSGGMSADELADRILQRMGV